MTKIIRITTVPVSLGGLLKGQLKFMSNYYEIIGISSEGSTTINSGIHDVAKEEGIRVIPVEMTRKITPFKDLRAVYELYKVFKKEKPIIVHSHTPKAGTLSMLAAKLAGVPNRLHTIAGLPLLVVTGPKRKLLDFVEKLTYSCATKIYPNSYGLKDIIVANKYTTISKLKVIAKGSSNGIDTSHFDPTLYAETDKVSLRKELSIELSDIVFLFVGRLVKDKGINELITAFKKINKAYDHAKLVLVGTYEKDLDPLDPETEKEINLNSNIISVGWQSDVRPFFSIADVLTFPSYREGFPNVVMQAGAMSLPSIVTDINGCNEIVSEGINGLIIPVKNTEALHNAMKKILTEAKLKERLGNKSREVIVNRYERTYVWEQLLKEYKELIN